MLLSAGLWLCSGPALAAKSTCTPIALGQLTERPGPGVLVLGERRGVLSDVKRAKKVVKSLAKQGPVTLAVEFVDAKRQPIIEKLSLGRVSIDALPNALAFGDEGYTFSIYRRLLTMPENVDGVTLVAIGQPFLTRPEDTPIALPPGYAMVLADAMGEYPVPPELESRTVQTAAYHDRRLAELALESWTGQGWLVLLVDRTWVQGGLGVAWQAARLTDVPVESVLLADPKADCYPDDRLLR